MKIILDKLPFLWYNICHIESEKDLNMSSRHQKKNKRHVRDTNLKIKGSSVVTRLSYRRKRGR